MNELVNRRERWFSVAIGLELTMLFLLILHLLISSQSRQYILQRSSPCH